MAAETTLITSRPELEQQYGPLDTAAKSLATLVNSWGLQDVQTTVPAASVLPTRDVTYPPVTRTVTPPKQGDSHPTIFSLTDDDPAQPTSEHWSSGLPKYQPGDLVVLVEHRFNRRTYIPVAPQHHDGHVITRGELEALQTQLNQMPRRGRYVQQYPRIVIGAPEEPSQRITSRLAQTMRDQLSRIPRIQFPSIPRSKAVYPADPYAALRQDPRNDITYAEQRHASPTPVQRQRIFPY